MRNPNSSRITYVLMSFSISMLSMASQPISAQTESGQSVPSHTSKENPLGKGVKAIKTDVSKGTKSVLKDIEHGAKKTGSEIGKGAKFVGSESKKGTEELANGTKKVAKDTEKGVSEVGSKTKKGFKTMSKHGDAKSPKPKSTTDDKIDSNTTDKVN